MCICIYIYMNTKYTLVNAWRAAHKTYTYIYMYNRRVHSPRADGNACDMTCMKRAALRPQPRVHLIKYT